MKEQNHYRPVRSRKEVMLYVFGIFMLVFYLGMAYMFLFSKLLAETMSPAVRYGMGILFTVYGVFRLYRQIRMKRQEDDNQ